VTEQFLSQEDFDRHWPAIAAEVRMMLAAKGRTRRRFRTVAVYERGTGDLLDEAVHTSVGPVVVLHYANSRVVPLSAPNQRLHLKTRLRGKSTEPGALAVFDGTDTDPYLATGDFITRTSPNATLIFR
jgi:hypothetical protein